MVRSSHEKVLSSGKVSVNHLSTLPSLFRGGEYILLPLQLTLAVPESIPFNKMVDHVTI